MKQGKVMKCQENTGSSNQMDENELLITNPKMTKGNEFFLINKSDFLDKLTINK